jgi:5-methylcytosine-specific restriction protein A
MPPRIPAYRPQRLPGASTHHTEYNRTRRDPRLLAIYSGRAWQRFRESIRRERVFCQRCKAEGQIIAAELVHHLRDPRDFPEGTYDPANVELLCRACHNREHKTRPIRDGGG